MAAVTLTELREWFAHGCASARRGERLRDPWPDTCGEMERDLLCCDAFYFGWWEATREEADRGCPTARAAFAKMPDGFAARVALRALALRAGGPVKAIDRAATLPRVRVA